jgi:hypothetical protein
VVQFAIVIPRRPPLASRDLGAPCECLAFFARQKVARSARIPGQANCTTIERRNHEHKEARIAGLA